jgi:hypothetical protein
MKVLHLSLIIDNYDFLNNKVRPQWKHVEKLQDDHNTTTYICKNLNEKEQYEGVHHKP